MRLALIIKKSLDCFEHGGNETESWPKLLLNLPL